MRIDRHLPDACQMSTPGWRGKPAQGPKTGRLLDRKLAFEMSPEFFGAPSLRSAFPFGDWPSRQQRLRRVLGLAVPGNGACGA